MTDQQRAGYIAIRALLIVGGGLAVQSIVAPRVGEGYGFFEIAGFAIAAVSIVPTVVSHLMSADRDRHPEA